MYRPACSSSFSNENIVTLIQLYEFHRCFWDSTQMNYRNKDLREDAWKAISNEMKIPIQLLKKKMTTLLATNRKERSKIKKSLVTGSGADDVYKSKWFASEYFAFLNDKDKPLSTTESAIITSNNNTENVNESISNDVQSASGSASTIQQVSSDLTSDIQQAPSNALSFTQQASSDALSSTEQAPSNSLSSIQQTPSNSASSTQQQHNTSFRNKRRRMQLNKDETDVNLTEAVGLLKHSVQYLSKEEDCYTSFGNHIAHELKKYNSRTFSLVKHAINNIIFQADMGQLPDQSYGYYTNPYSTDLTNSTSRQSNYSDTPSSAQTAHTSAPEPQRETPSDITELLSYVEDGDE